MPEITGTAAHGRGDRRETYAQTCDLPVPADADGFALHPDSRVEDLTGVGKVRAGVLNKAGMYTLRDLALRLPAEYRDPSCCASVRQLRAGERALCVLKTLHPPSIERRKKWVIVSCEMQDADGDRVRCVWFGQTYLQQKMQPGSVWMLCGTPSWRDGRLCLVGAALEAPPRSAEDRAIRAMYPMLSGISQATQRHWVTCALGACQGSWGDVLPEPIRTDYGLFSREEAIRRAHFPEGQGDLSVARNSLAFEDLLLFQVAMRSLRGGAERDGAPPMGATEALLSPALGQLPFDLTGAQKRVLGEILDDLRRPVPMARLVQGDVGCGKTALALLALYAAAKCGFQGALMAPTEILAEQHLMSATELLGPLGVRVGLLTGSMGVKARREARAAIHRGAWDVVIGTHALISDGVEYANLGLVVTDEQHRFGVAQRSRLQDKGRGDGGERATRPHMLVMSATPIPRTLALVMYCDLSLSVVDELPPGRTPVRTHLVPERKRRDMYRFLREQVKEGRQGYVVCPLVELSEEVDAASAIEVADELRAFLPDLSVECVHGRQKAADKSEALERFRDGEIDVLVSTTVIEVGVNVPNATVMIVENAERFGLAQLHQLRGRVGRGSAVSYCFLMSESGGRLEILARTTDGFAVAQEDLRQRGPGALLGERQSGGIDEVLAMAGDVRLLEQTHALAERYARRDDSEAEALRRAALLRYGSRTGEVGLH